MVFRFCQGVGSKFYNFRTGYYSGKNILLGIPAKDQVRSNKNKITYPVGVTLSSKKIIPANYSGNSNGVHYCGKKEEGYSGKRYSGVLLPSRYRKSSGRGKIRLTLPYGELECRGRKGNRWSVSERRGGRYA